MIRDILEILPAQMHVRRQRRQLNLARRGPFRLHFMRFRPRWNDRLIAPRTEAASDFNRRLLRKNDPGFRQIRSRLSIGRVVCLQHHLGSGLHAQRPPGNAKALRIAGQRTARSAIGLRNFNNRLLNRPTVAPCGHELPGSLR